MDTRRYFELIVQPTFEEYRGDPLSIRRVLLACMVITHIADCIAEQTNKSQEEVVRWLSSKCGSFDRVRAVGLVSKHFKLSRRDYKGLRVTDVRVIKGAAFDDGTYFDDGFSWDDSPDVMGVQSTEYGPWDLSFELENAFGYLDQLTQELASSVPPTFSGS